MSVDNGRAAVYAAESAAFEGTVYESIIPLDELIDLARTITSAQWWPRGEIEVVSARRDAGSSSAVQPGRGRPIVRLAPPQMTPATVVHEFAHVLAGIDARHGPLFRCAHLDLIGFIFGDGEARWLLEAYVMMDLDAAERCWPVPPIRQRPARGPIALGS